MSKFLYKINSGYDGFRPVRIPERLIEGNRLRLLWKLYIDNVRIGDQVWVYFHGQGKYTNGVYIEGVVREINIADRAVYIRVFKYDVANPLTNDMTSLRVAQAVSTRYQQVFLYPQDWHQAPQCTIESTVSSCETRSCDDCETWQGLPLVDVEDYTIPPRLDLVDAYFPAYWVVPSRCNWPNASITPEVHRTSDLFYRFKNGEANLAYPLSLGIYETLRQNDGSVYDGIVPIPLSPDKAEAGEVNRTRILSRELGRLLNIPVVNALSLNCSISKRRMIPPYTIREFENAYEAALVVAPRIARLNRILLLDDVCTRGSTLTRASLRIQQNAPDIEITAVTAGQMLIKNVVTGNGPFI